jgi:hypothetical protein
VNHVAYIYTLILKGLINESEFPFEDYMSYLLHSFIRFLMC